MFVNSEEQKDFCGWLVFVPLPVGVRRQVSAVYTHTSVKKSTLREFELCAALEIKKHD